jgi:DNA invertase Pin-like site-specific DNA recombinase
MENWGYMRVSTNQTDQAASWAQQEANLNEWGVAQVFKEEASASGMRPVFDTMIDKAIEHAEDTSKPVYIHVQKMDRAFRDLEQALGTIKRAAKRAVMFVLHDISPAPLDPKDPAQALLVSVLGAIGQFEKDRFAERRRVGIARAQKAGKYKGRAPTARAKTDEVLVYKTRGMSVEEIKKLTGISQASVYRILKDSTEYPAKGA